MQRLIRVVPFVIGLATVSTTGCQTQQYTTQPSPMYLQHVPQYMPATSDVAPIARAQAPDRIEPIDNSEPATSKASTPTPQAAPTAKPEAEPLLLPPAQPPAPPAFTVPAPTKRSFRQRIASLFGSGSDTPPTTMATLPDGTVIMNGSVVPSLAAPPLYTPNGPIASQPPLPIPSNQAPMYLPSAPGERIGVDFSLTPPLRSGAATPQMLPLPPLPLPPPLPSSAGTLRMAPQMLPPAITQVVPPRQAVPPPTAEQLNAVPAQLVEMFKQGAFDPNVLPTGATTVAKSTPTLTSTSASKAPIGTWYRETERPGVMVCIKLTADTIQLSTMICVDLDGVPTTAVFKTVGEYNVSKDATTIYGYVTGTDLTVDGNKAAMSMTPDTLLELRKSEDQPFSFQFSVVDGELYVRKWHVAGRVETGPNSLEHTTGKYRLADAKGPPKPTPAKQTAPVKQPRTDATPPLNSPTAPKAAPAVAPTGAPNAVAPPVAPPATQQRSSLTDGLELVSSLLGGDPQKGAVVGSVMGASLGAMIGEAAGDTKKGAAMGGLLGATLGAKLAVPPTQTTPVQATVPAPASKPSPAKSRPSWNERFHAMTHWLGFQPSAPRYAVDQPQTVPTIDRIIEE